MWNNKGAIDAGRQRVQAAFARWTSQWAYYVKDAPIKNDLLLLILNQRMVPSLAESITLTKWLHHHIISTPHTQHYGDRLLEVYYRRILESTATFFDDRQHYRRKLLHSRSADWPSTRPSYVMRMLCSANLMVEMTALRPPSSDRQLMMHVIVEQELRGALQICANIFSAFPLAQTGTPPVFFPHGETLGYRCMRKGVGVVEQMLSSKYNDGAHLRGSPSRLNHTMVHATKKLCHFKKDLQDNSYQLRSQPLRQELCRTIVGLMVASTQHSPWLNFLSRRRFFDRVLRVGIEPRALRSQLRSVEQRLNTPWSSALWISVLNPFVQDPLVQYLREHRGRQFFYLRPIAEGLIMTGAAAMAVALHDTIGPFQHVVESQETPEVDSSMTLSELTPTDPYKAGDNMIDQMLEDMDAALEGVLGSTLQRAY